MCLKEKFQLTPSGTSLTSGNFNFSPLSQTKLRIKMKEVLERFKRSHEERIPSKAFKKLNLNLSQTDRFGQLASMTCSDIFAAIFGCQFI